MCASAFLSQHDLVDSCACAFAQERGVYCRYEQNPAELFMADAAERALQRCLRPGTTKETRFDQTGTLVDQYTTGHVAAGRRWVRRDAAPGHGAGARKYRGASVVFQVV